LWNQQPHIPTKSLPSVRIASIQWIKQVVAFCKNSAVVLHAVGDRSATHAAKSAAPCWTRTSILCFVAPRAITLSMMMEIVWKQILVFHATPLLATHANEMLRESWIRMVKLNVPIANITSTVMVIVNHKTEVTVIHVMDLIQTAQLVIMNCMKTAMKTMTEITFIDTVAMIAHTLLTAMATVKMPWMVHAVIAIQNVPVAMHGSVITVLTVHIEQRVSVPFAIAIIRM
jgi:hypothetical protein